MKAWYRKTFNLKLVTTTNAIAFELYRYYSCGLLPAVDFLSILMVLLYMRANFLSILMAHACVVVARKANTFIAYGSPVTPSFSSMTPLLSATVRQSC